MDLCPRATAGRKRYGRQGIVAGATTDNPRGWSVCCCAALAAMLFQPLHLLRPVARKRTPTKSRMTGSVAKPRVLCRPSGQAIARKCSQLGNAPCFCGSGLARDGDSAGWPGKVLNPRSLVSWSGLQPACQCLVAAGAASTVLVNCVVGKRQLIRWRAVHCDQGRLPQAQGEVLWKRAGARKPLAAAVLTACWSSAALQWADEWNSLSAGYGIDAGRGLD